MSDSKPSLFTSNLFLRLLSAFVLIPVVLGGVWVGDWAYDGMIVVVLMLGMSEWMGLTGQKMTPRGKSWAYVALLAVFLVAMLKGVGSALLLSLLATLILAYYASVGQEKNRDTTYRSLWIAAGIPYLAWSGLAMIYLRAIPDRGLFLIVYLLLVVWGTDTGAYFSGRLIGGPKLLPKISPKKTWAGLLGGMVFAGVLGYGAARGFDESHAICFAVLGVVLAVVSQAGDFFESYAKRRAGAKDSGTLIPGHGGVLDRIDGLLFASIVLALVSFLLG